jgi:hypothetical protein
MHIQTHLHAGQGTMPRPYRWPPGPHPCLPSRVLAGDLNDALDRLGWSSLTAPNGPDWFDAFATAAPQRVVLTDPEGDFLCDGATLLRLLTAMAPPLTAEILRDTIRSTCIPDDYSTSPLPRRTS